MKKKTNTKDEPRFDEDGYQLGEPNILGEPIGEVFLKTQKFLTQEEAMAIGLPSIDALVGERPQEKITLAVDRDALTFFKTEAKKRKTSYQRMIRNLISSYARANAGGAVLKQGR
jgi:hypothetical protein